MKTINVAAKKIKGMSIRTTNAYEMNPDTAKIGNLHQRFDDVVSVDYKNGARVYGVYYDYESDANGEFSVLSGADHIESSSQELEEITLPAGDYLVFEAEGEIPQAVIDCWVQIWKYFSSDNPSHQRAYTTDYEHYKNPNEVDVYIALK